MALKRILIVDDDVALLKLFTRLLQDQGHLVHTATSVESAYQILNKHQFDVCICDMTLGLHSGVELLNYSPVLQANGTRFAVISGKKRYEELCHSIGVEFRLKPIANADLLALVDGDSSKVNHSV